MNKKELLKDLKFDSETYKRECSIKMTCAICGNKASFGCHIRLNEHCKKCYDYHNRKVRKEKMNENEARKFYKKLLKNGISEKEYKTMPRWINSE